MLILVFSQIDTAGAQTGSTHEPVRLVGQIGINPDVHDGGLRPPIGVHSHQTLRVNRTHPERADGYGWTYNHASNLAYWNDKFYQQYLSNPVDEHIPPGHTLIVTSENGRDWSKPEVVFPAYEAPEGVEIPEGYSGYMMHQRMGFYVAPNDRLLVLGFYGHSEDPFEEGGIGRVVREVYRDGTFGPIYFIRYSSHTDWDESNTSFPFYKTSTDKAFIEACDALLGDKLKTLQWWEEDHGLDGFYSFGDSGSAFNYYRRLDGKIVGLWKRSLFAISEDDGRTFSKPVKVPTLIMAGGKQWGQKTEDGRYAIAYNPIEMDEHRYPLAVITSDDGIIYDDMLVVQGEVPPRKFYGRWKDFGPCYIRGIVEGNGDPPGQDLWLTYSMNKEDMWVSRVPLPIHHLWEGDVNDNFDGLEAGGEVPNWNLYDPVWAPVGVAEAPSDSGKSLRLEDRDPYDYARAVRVFEEGEEVELKLKVMAAQSVRGMLDIEVTDRYGGRPVQIRFDSDGKIKAKVGADWEELIKYSNDQWLELEIRVDATPHGSFDVSIDGEKVLADAPLAMAVKSAERLSIRTGPYRNLPNRKTDNQDPGPPLPGADEPLPSSVFYVDDVNVITR
ncbi:MAG: hypothetical protein KC978_04770 [Candidatus Omnitrophica bacterium]|nr:hypothetical protein [Candidatus Omnitrophota bacterium]